MQIKNGLVCRYCGKSWYPHSLQPHEKSCRQKILIILDELKRRRIINRTPKIPEYTEEILPNLKQTDQIRLYNAWAMGVFESVKLTCEYCGRKISPHAFNEHQAECAISHPVPEFHHSTPRRTATQDVKGTHLAGTKKVFKGPKYFDGNLNKVEDPDAVPEWMRKEIEMRKKYNEEQKMRSADPPVTIYGAEEEYGSPSSASSGAPGVSRIPKPSDPKPWQVKRTSNGQGSLQNTGAGGFDIQPNAYSAPNATGSRPRTGGRIGTGDKGGSGAPLNRGNNEFNTLLSMAEGDSGGPDNRIACSNCGRKFAADRIAKHESICLKSKSGPIASLKAHSNNLACAATEEAKGMLEQASKVDPQKEKKLKQIAEIKANERRLFKDKKLAASQSALSMGGAGGMGGIGGGRGGGGLMSLQSVEPNDGREACRYCGRKFNPDRIAKHEEICSRVENKPDRVARKLPTGIGLKGAGFSPQARDVSRYSAPKAASRPSVTSSGYGATRPTQKHPSNGTVGKRSITMSSANPKFCGNCGCSLVGSPRFCSSCGYPLK